MGATMPNSLPLGRAPTQQEYNMLVQRMQQMQMQQNQFK